MRYNKIYPTLKLRRLLPSRSARHLPPGGRLFVSPIITQIGRENKFSAEVFVPNNSPLRMQREGLSVPFWSKCGGILFEDIRVLRLTSKLVDLRTDMRTPFCYAEVKFSASGTAQKEKRTAGGSLFFLVEVWRFELQASSTRSVSE